MKKILVAFTLTLSVFCCTSPMDYKSLNNDKKHVKDTAPDGASWLAVMIERSKKSSSSKSVQASKEELNKKSSE